MSTKYVLTQADIRRLRRVHFATGLIIASPDGELRWGFGRKPITDASARALFAALLEAAALATPEEEPTP